MVRVSRHDIERAIRVDFFIIVDRLVSYVIENIKDRESIPIDIVYEFKNRSGIPDDAWEYVFQKAKRILESNYGIVFTGASIERRGDINYKAILERIINTFIGMGNCYVKFFESIYETHKDDFEKLFDLMRKVGILINEEDGHVYIGMGDYDTEKMREMVLTKKDMELIKRIAPIVNGLGTKRITEYEFLSLLDEENLTRVFYGDEERLRLKFIAVPKFVEVPIRIKKKDFKDVLRREVGLIFSYDGNFEEFMENLIARSRLIRETKLSEDASEFFFALLDDLSQAWVNFIKPNEKAEGFFAIIDERNRELLVPVSLIDGVINRVAKRFQYKKNRSRLMTELYSQGILKATSSLVKKIGGKSIRVWVFNTEYPDIKEVLKKREKMEKATDEFLNLESV